MKSLLTAAALLASLIASASTQAQNFNVINGNSNRVFNGGGFGGISSGFGGGFVQRPVGNFNQINGNRNTVVNGGAFHSGLRPVQTQRVFIPQQRPIVHQPTVFPRPFVVPQRRFGGQQFNVNQIQGNRNVVSNRNGGRFGGGLGGLLGGVKVNINRVQGNNNSIFNE